MNNDYFTVEKTKDGFTFENVGIVDGAGNSTSIIMYSFWDSLPYDGVSYYRLQQTDFNGKSTYSHLNAVDFDVPSDFDFNVYPNPSTGDFSITLKANLGNEVLVYVYDVLGKEAYSKVLITEVKGENVYSINQEGTLAPGVYMVTATSDDAVLNKKLIISK
jgi:hypothetical protein